MATDWIEVGAERMRVKRRQMRISAEEVAVRMRRNGYKLTARTYERWETRGEVPREALPALAAVLGFDHGKILNDQPTRVQWQQIGEALREVMTTQKLLVELLAEQRAVVGQLQEIAASLAAPSAPPDRSRVEPERCGATS